MNISSVTKLYMGFLPLLKIDTPLYYNKKFSFIFRSLHEYRRCQLIRYSEGFIKFYLPTKTCCIFCNQINLLAIILVCVIRSLSKYYVQGIKGNGLIENETNLGIFEYYCHRNVRT